jgi:hypothetical protein
MSTINIRLLAIPSFKRKPMDGEEVMASDYLPPEVTICEMIKSSLTSINMRIKVSLQVVME